MNLEKAIEILKLDHFQSPHDLKMAFRNLAFELHPDKNPFDDEASERFRELVEAYEYCVSNSEALALHFEISGFRDETVEEEVFQAEVTIDVDDIFNDIFGFSTSGRVIGYQKPSDLWLSVEEIACGGQKKAEIDYYETCSSCSGQGTQDKRAAHLCRYCFGRGVLNLVDKKSVCPQCHGKGRQIENPCESCEGFGRVLKRAKKTFRWPVGLLPGQEYTLETLENGGSAGHLFVRVHVKPHPVFQIENYDLLCEYHVDPKDLGGRRKHSLKTPIEDVVLFLAGDVKDGDVIVREQKGLYRGSARNERGTLRIRICFAKEKWWQKLRRMILE